jgi:hypothetical protein
MIEPFHIIIASTKLGSDECIYVQSPLIKIFDTTAKLTFLPCDNPLKEKQNRKWTQFRESPPENMKGRFKVRSWYDADEKFDNITKIIVELFTPCYGAFSNPDKTIREEKRLWTVLVPLIAQICRDLFPNSDMNASIFALIFADQQVFGCEKNFSELNVEELHTSPVI